MNDGFRSLDDLEHDLLRYQDAKLWSGFRDMQAKRYVRVLNIPCAFDIEATSYLTDGGDPAATMYAWALQIDRTAYLGRSWMEFIRAMNTIQRVLNLGDSRRVYIYVHNLSYDFQFYRHWLTWEKVFAIQPVTPIFARTTGGIEFRCSYTLSGYNLATLAKGIKCREVRKMTGDLDYLLPRHSETRLTDEELEYIRADVDVVCAYIQDKINDDGNITKIPYTKTGYVRRFCRRECLRKEKHSYKQYHWLMDQLQLDPDEYRQLKRAYQGGFAHANSYRAGRTWTNVESWDICSSYPAVMVSEGYPMSRGQRVPLPITTRRFKDYLRRFCCLFDVRFYNLRATQFSDHPISASRCSGVEGGEYDNGRVMAADMLTMTMTDVDWDIIDRFYTWEHHQIANLRIYRRGYLPTPFVDALLQLYEDKTRLKGVPGAEVQYQRAKEMLNSAYGMAVTDICRDTFGYTDDWEEVVPADPSTEIPKYNSERNRFLFYPWGVWRRGSRHTPGGGCLR